VDSSLQNINQVVSSTLFDPHVANLASIRYKYLSQLHVENLVRIWPDLLSMSDLTRYLAWTIVLYINAGIS
jgi:hypothetical protein